MQNLDLGPTHKTGDAKHKINDLFFEIFHFDEKNPLPWPKNDFFANLSNVVSV